VAALNVVHLSRGGFHQFGDATLFNDDLSAWSTGELRHMDAMFFDAQSFEGRDLTEWDTSRITSMSALFHNAISFQGNVSTWDVSRVTNFEQTFSHCRVFHGDVSSWNTSSATTMKEMFDRAHQFSSDISSWDVRNVEDTYLMVRYHSELFCISRRMADNRICLLYCDSLWKAMPSTLICQVGTCPV
jgi:surface protein